MSQDLPKYINFEYMWVLTDDNDEDSEERHIEVRPHLCVGIDEETDSYIWEPDEASNVYFNTEEAALSYIRTHGKLAESFKNKLN